ncbi:MAG TPA: alpha/beta hydrolase [Gemmatimonadaceae bacterium]|nr:alpha/beta hydrolase [Gemmatimonadaceae bacterium]
MTTATAPAPTATAVPRAQPLHFGPDAAPLFGWHHRPAGEPRDACVVISSPFAVEAVFSHRALRHLSEALAAEGFHVLRYDHHGTLDSSGAGDERDRVATWTSGVQCAIETARALSGAARSAVVGLRLGATLAAAAASPIGGVESLALWAPIVNGRRYARELGAFSQMGGAPGSGGVGGFFVGPDTLEEIAKLNLLQLSRSPARRTLIIPRDDLPDDGTLAMHLASLGSDVQSNPAPGYSDAMVEPHNTKVPDRVVRAITEWLARSHPRSVPGSASFASAEKSASAPFRLVSPEVRERPVFLDARKRLFGIVSEPAHGRCRDTGIVMANAGAVSRVGPNRLYVTMAREWAASGFRVLRLDIGGIGDSAAAPSVPENHTYSPNAVDDIVTGIGALRAIGNSKFVAAGLCSGAHATFHLGVERPDVGDIAGLILINPIVFYWKPGDSLDVSAWRNYVEARRYQSQARNPQAWRKVLSGKVNVLTAARTVVQRWATVAGATIGRRLARRDAPGNLANDLLTLTARPLELLMLFSDGDPGLDQLRLHAGHTLRALGQRPNFRLERIPNADHTFTQLDAQTGVRALLLDHLTQRFT